MNDDVEGMTGKEVMVCSIAKSWK